LQHRATKLDGSSILEPHLELSLSRPVACGDSRKHRPSKEVTTLTVLLRVHFSFDVVGAKHGLFEFDFFHAEEWHAERLQGVLQALVIEDDLEK
jgi:hypothetical protein